MARFGSLGTQYFGNAGDPLIDGKIYFKESGTDTDKDTFADVTLEIKNTNPVILSGAGRQPNVFFDGSARVILTDSDDAQIEVRDPVGGDAEEGAFGTWDSLTIYNLSDIVKASDGLFYLSISNANQDNDPTTDAVNWSEIRFIRIWNANETYSVNRIVEGSDGLLYTSLTNSNLGNDPTTDAINWGSSAGLTLSLFDEVVVSGGAVTEIDFTGLDINTHKSYRIEIELVNAGFAMTLGMISNNDTSSLYNSQFCEFDDATVVASSIFLTTGRILDINSAQNAKINISLALTESEPTATFSNYIELGTSSSVVVGGWSLAGGTVANITQLTFISDTVNSLGDGTRIRIYREDV